MTVSNALLMSVDEDAVRGLFEEQKNDPVALKKALVGAVTAGKRLLLIDFLERAPRGRAFRDACSKALLVAANEGRMHFVRLLLPHADPNTDNAGPLLQAASARREALVALLAPLSDVGLAWRRSLPGKTPKASGGGGASVFFHLEPLSRDLLTPYVPLSALAALPKEALEGMPKARARLEAAAMEHELPAAARRTRQRL